MSEQPFDLAPDRALEPVDHAVDHTIDHGTGHAVGEHAGHAAGAPAAASQAAPPTVSLEDVLAARAVLGDALHRTPIETSEAYSALFGADVRLKCEHLQRTGSFKVRGAMNRMAQLSDGERRRGVVAASAGNHAQGVAWAARRLGVDAEVHMPADAALPKVEATQSYGARVVLDGDTVEDAVARARLVALEEGRTFVHPFDHPAVVAGQGTVGLEILEQVPDVGTIVVPTGGGGLLAGIAAAVPADVRVIGVQAARAAAYPASLAAGRPVSVPPQRTMADGIAVGLPGDVPFAVVAGRGVPVVTVSEDELSRAVLSLAERAKQVVEPAGAAGIAALVPAYRAGGNAAAADLVDRERPVVVVLSGGNVDPVLLRKLFRYGMAAAGRYLHLRATIPDRPGALAGLLGVVGACRGDVVTVSHVRTGVGISIEDTTVDLEIATKGWDHSAAIVAAMRREGYPTVER